MNGGRCGTGITSQFYFVTPSLMGMVVWFSHNNKPKPCVKNCSLFLILLYENICSDDHVKFFCLQVLEHHVKTRHAFSSDDDILALRKVLLTWMQPQEKVKQCNHSYYSRKTFGEC